MAFPRLRRVHDDRMNSVIFTALGVGGATVLGGVIGLIFGRTTKLFCDAVLSFAAGVMLAASFIGLILPAVEFGRGIHVFVVILGIMLGAGAVNLLDSLPLLNNLESQIREDLPPKKHRKPPKPTTSPPKDRTKPPETIGQHSTATIKQGTDTGSEDATERMRRVILFVSAIALHNLPEGIAAGVGLVGDRSGGGILIALAIAMQNLPEGLIVATSMIGVGVDRKRAFIIASLTGLIEIFGTFFGYFAAGVSTFALPLILALAGGTMLYVISEEMIPETHSGEGGRMSTWFLLFGFSLILIIDAFL